MNLEQSWTFFIEIVEVLEVLNFYFNFCKSGFLNLDWFIPSNKYKQLTTLQSLY